MNNKIKELLDQSTEDILGVPVVNQEKFAHLIVKECASVCDVYGMPDGTSETAWWRSETARILSEVIKSKFGIKE